MRTAAQPARSASAMARRTCGQCGNAGNAAGRTRFLAGSRLYSDHQSFTAIFSRWLDTLPAIHALPATALGRGIVRFLDGSSGWKAPETGKCRASSESLRFFLSWRGSRMVVSNSHPKGRSEPPAPHPFARSGARRTRSPQVPPEKQAVERRNVRPVCGFSPGSGR